MPRCSFQEVQPKNPLAQPAPERDPHRSSLALHLAASRLFTGGNFHVQGSYLYRAFLDILSHTLLLRQADEDILERFADNEPTATIRRSPPIQQRPTSTRYFRERSNTGGNTGASTSNNSALKAVQNEFYSPRPWQTARAWLHQYR